MNRMSRTVVAGALAAVVALGAAPAAVAGPHGHGHGHGKSDKVAAKAMKKDRVAKAGHASGKYAALAKRAERKAAYLDRLAQSQKVTGLGDAGVPVVLNMSEDGDELTDLAAALRSGVSTATDLADVREMRPEVYNRIVSQIRHVNELIAELTAAPVQDPAVVTDPATDPLATDPLADAPLADAPVATTAIATVADPAAQLAALEALLAELQGYDARTSRADLKLAQMVIAAAEESLDDSDEDADDEDADDETEDEVVDEVNDDEQPVS